MKSYKLKILLIFFCCFVISVWTKIQGIEDKLTANFELAKNACQSIQNFTVLNKPTQCEMLFKPINGYISNNSFQVLLLFDDTLMGIHPSDETWYNIPSHFRLLYTEIRKKTVEKYRYELNFLNKIFQSNKIQYTEKEYIESLLLYKISEHFVSYYRMGNCGELVAFSTFFLLKKRYNEGTNFNLEVIQLTSSIVGFEGKNITHVVGVIDRRIDSDLSSPPSWGENAVVYDPWNNASYFEAKYMMDRDYYKYGKWNKWEIEVSFNTSGSHNYSDFFRSYEKYIIGATIPRGVLCDYIASHIFPEL